jgi:hypothetical protein
MLIDPQSVVVSDSNCQTDPRAGLLNLAFRFAVQFYNTLELYCGEENTLDMSNQACVASGALA